MYLPIGKHVRCVLLFSAACEDKTKPKIKVVAQRETITPVWKASHDRLTVQSAGVCQQEVAAKDGNTSISTGI